MERKKNEIRRSQHTNQRGRGFLVGALESQGILPEAIEAKLEHVESGLSDNGSHPFGE